MKAEKRKKLKAEDVLMLSRREDGKYAQECRILSVEGEGGSTVCYSAVYGGKRGRLKEFYPTKASYGKICKLLSLTRSENGQLVTEKPEEQMQYRAMCEEFFKVYRMLDEKKVADKTHEVLNNYLPVYHLLYGVCEGEHPLAGAYVWTPDDTHGQSFEDYLQEIHRNPAENAIHKLYYVISTVLTLTECIQALHQVGLLHLDIKPSNFLVSYNSAKEINSAQISLFDIDSICSIEDEPERLSGTKGFCAPEVTRGCVENRTDIYSIGAVLFRAIAGDGENEPEVYRTGYYKELEKKLSEAELVREVREQDTTLFIRMVTHILKKCLAFRPEHRYHCCEELAEDLQVARMMLMQGLVLNRLERYEGSSEEAEQFRRELMEKN